MPIKILEKVSDCLFPYLPPVPRIWYKELYRELYKEESKKGKMEIRDIIRVRGSIKMFREKRDIVDSVFSKFSKFSLFCLCILTS